MTDAINKQKLQLRGVASTNGDKNPSPVATKLLISHGKPNFTIQRSTSKVSQNGGSATRSLSPQQENNNNSETNDTVCNNNNKDVNYNPYRSANVNGANNAKAAANGNGELIMKGTKFNGVFKPSNLVVTSQQNNDTTENEAANVVLRRTARAPESHSAEEDDDTVPEFIRRQRRIQERLAKENVLDFENRRSGYFTHVLISPTSASRTSFAETMSSPAVVPSLEMAPPPSPKKEEHIEEAQEAHTNGHAAEETEQAHEQQQENKQTQAHKQIDEQTHEQEQENKQTLEQAHKQIDEQTHEQGHEQIQEQTHEHTLEHTQPQTHERKNEETHEETHEQKHKEIHEQTHEQIHEQTHEQKHEQSQLEEEAEVAKAIEEVNKAVAGEEDAADELHVTAVAVTTSAEQDDAVIQHEETVTISHTNGAADQQTQQHASGALCTNDANAQPFDDTVQVVTVEHVSPVLHNGTAESSIETEAHASGALCINLPNVKDNANITRQHSSGALVVHHDASAPLTFEDTAKLVPAAELVNNEQHVTGIAADSIECTQHASGAMVINHEPKLTETKVDDETKLHAMAQLKSDIKVEDAQNIEVTPVLKTV